MKMGSVSPVDSRSFRLGPESRDRTGQDTSWGRGGDGWYLASGVWVSWTEGIRGRTVSSVPGSEGVGL